MNSIMIRVRAYRCINCGRLWVSPVKIYAGKETIPHCPICNIKAEITPDTAGPGQAFLLEDFMEKESCPK